MPRSRANLGLIAAVVVAFFVFPARAQTTWYVDDDASTGGDGMSWSTAYKYLQDALAAAAAGDEVHVAGGTYNPDQDEAGNVTPSERTETFQLISGAGLYGGFRGCPGGDCTGDPDERDIDEYETILSGDLAGNDESDFANNDENSYHVVTGSGTGETTLLDGFTVTGGNANASYPNNGGGGMFNVYGNPTLMDCTFSENSASAGGGVRNDNSDPILANCKFSGNSGAYSGGGMFNNESAPSLTNCLFLGNSSTSGGGVCNVYSYPTLANCTFSGNSAGWVGGGMDNNSSSPTLVNCTFSGNSAGLSGGGIRNNWSGPTLTNCILWSNRDLRGDGRPGQIFDGLGSLTTATYSCVQDAMPGDGDVYPGLANIDGSPLFLDADGPDGIPGTGDEDLSLTPRSPCLDVGDNTAVPADVYDLDGDGDTSEPLPIDLAGLDRFFDDPCSPDLGNPDPLWPALAIMDMGAQEYQGDLLGDPDGDGLTGCNDNCPLHDNPDQADCDLDGLGDVCAVTLGASRDCQPEGEAGHGIPDVCDIVDGTSTDVDGNHMPDECQTVFCVDDNAPLGGNGQGWPTAFKHLQDALAASVAGDEIHVAGGIHTPDQDEAGNVTAGDREATFQLVNGVNVRGGYRGCPGGDCAGGDPNERDIGLYESVLSGDLAGDDAAVASPDDLLDEPTRAENSYHVVTGSGTGETTRLDGFTVIGGNANASSPHRTGGGMANLYGDPTVTHCTFSSNSADWRGGALYNQFSSDPTLTECTFSGNSAHHGGGMFNYHYSDVTLMNCVFSGNRADTGGGVYSSYGDTMLTNCTFSRNSAVFRGGAMYNTSSQPTLINCVLWEDEPDEIYSAGSSSTATVSFSDIEGGLPDYTINGGGNIVGAPSFMDADGPDDIPGTGDDDLRLSLCSPTIDAGNNTAVPADVHDLDDDGDVDEPIPFDRDGNPRFVDDAWIQDTGDGTPPIVDMGAYEFQGTSIECCGNGTIEGSEECDDGDTDDTDYCLNTCELNSAIPTVSGWSLVAMTLLVLAAGTVVLRRRRVAWVV
ncbi:MAG: hypothetical protein JSU86_17985 [Phycisphaerales bacterium]|nr:MAG: hypothetical protein JSU86_17985 [Phycisphaerales bacterium]